VELDRRLEQLEDAEREELRAFQAKMTEIELKRLEHEQETVYVGAPLWFAVNNRPN